MFAMRRIREAFAVHTPARNCEMFVPNHAENYITYQDFPTFLLFFYPSTTTFNNSINASTLHLPATYPYLHDLPPPTFSNQQPRPCGVSSQSTRYGVARVAMRKRKTLTRPRGRTQPRFSAKYSAYSAVTKESFTRRRFRFGQIHRAVFQ